MKLTMSSSPYREEQHTWEKIASQFKAWSVKALARQRKTLAFSVERPIVFLVFIASLVLLPNFANADSSDPILSLPDDSILLNLSASATRTIDQDELVATLRASSKDRSVTSVQNQVNTLMQKALAAAKKTRDIQYSTGSYQVYERTDPRSKEVLWVAQQSIILRSTSADDLLKLTQSLQSAGLQMTQLNYQVSKKRYRATKDELLDEALSRLQSQAERTAKNLGKKRARIAEVSIDEQASTPSSRSAFAMRSNEMMMADSVSAPVASAGESEISVSVSGRALLN